MRRGQKKEGGTERGEEKGEEGQREMREEEKMRGGGGERERE